MLYLSIGLAILLTAVITFWAISRKSQTGRPSSRPRRRVAQRRTASHHRGGARRFHREATSRIPSWKIAAGLAGVVALGAVGYVTGAFSSVTDPGSHVALRIVYTAQTAEDAPFDLGPELKSALRQVGLKHGSISISRIDGTGEVETTIVDLTARIDDKKNSPPLIHDRAIPVIDRKISGIEMSINSIKSGTGSRALFTGLTRIAFTDVPTYILSSGLDLSDPVAFPKLNWATMPQDVVNNIKAAGELPHLHGPVTFIVTPTAGAQEQLRAKQATYRNDVWQSVLTSSGATNVTFVDASQTGSSSGPSSPPVPLSAAPETPIVPRKSMANPKRATCTVPTAYFIVNTPTLIDEVKTIAALRPCIEAAAATSASFELDGWTSYEGPLDAAGRPSADDQGNRNLSDARVRTIAELLTEHLGVRASQITAMRGHGNTDQPDPDPRSPTNRRVDISYTTN